MKTCNHCGYANFKVTGKRPKCPKCKKYYGESYNCNPLSSSTKDYNNGLTIEADVR